MEAVLHVGRAASRSVRTVRTTSSRLHHLPCGTSGHRARFETTTRPCDRGPFAAAASGRSHYRARWCFQVTSEPNSRAAASPVAKSATPSPRVTPGIVRANVTSVAMQAAAKKHRLFLLTRRTPRGWLPCGSRRDRHATVSAVGRSVGGVGPWSTSGGRKTFSSPCDGSHRREMLAGLGQPRRGSLAEGSGCNAGGDLLVLLLTSAGSSPSACPWPARRRACPCNGRCASAGPRSPGCARRRSCP